MGYSPLVKTQNRIPIRESFKQHGIEWQKIYSNWPQIEQRCLEFQQWLNARSKIIIAIGSENHATVLNLLNLDSTMEAVKVTLDIPMKMFGEAPYMLAIRSRLTSEIMQLILFSFHSQHFFNPGIKIHIRAFHDLLWNAACDMANVKIDTSTHFIQLAESVRRTAEKSSMKWVATQMHLAFGLRHHEKETGIILPEALVRRTFMKTLSQDFYAEKFVSFNGSWVGGICKAFSMKGAETWRSIEWRNSSAFDPIYMTHIKNFLERNEENRLKGQVTMATEEWRVSDAAKRRNKGLANGPKSRRYVMGDKIKALQNSYQARQLISASPDTLNLYQQGLRQTLMNLDTGEYNYSKKKNFLRKHCVFWDPSTPGGLRWKNDRGPPGVDDPTRPHPAVQLERNMKTSDREAFFIRAAKSS
ncbi:hypothetical protein BFJ69_g862 [Fusarium oxysporum]|uniref:Uncharacterized protein n=1 Tax=Fusarium oxysporum TaxID=5507 RepID=A0A420P286_FUSOX|nr:hypothetical protein BFJ69_g862 [Fusarium oxysporum]